MTSYNSSLLDDLEKLIRKKSLRAFKKLNKNKKSYRWRFLFRYFFIYTFSKIVPNFCRLVLMSTTYLQNMKVFFKHGFWKHTLFWKEHIIQPMMVFQAYCSRWQLWSELQGTFNLFLITAGKTEQPCQPHNGVNTKGAKIMAGVVPNQLELSILLLAKQKWYFVSKIILTYCEKKLF